MQRMTNRILCGREDISTRLQINLYYITYKLIIHHIIQTEMKTIITWMYVYYIQNKTEKLTHRISCIIYYNKGQKNVVYVLTLRENQAVHLIYSQIRKINQQ